MQEQKAIHSCVVCDGGLELLDWPFELRGNISGFPGETYPFLLGACSDCGLVQKPLTQGYQDFLAEVYQKHYTFFAPNFNELADGERARGLAVIELVCKLKNSKNLIWLDYGCGGGNFLHLLRLTKPLWNCCGYDVSNVNYDKFKNLGIDFYYAEQEIKGKFDCVSLNMVLEHATKPLAMLQKVHSLLEHDGLLVIRIPNFQTLPSDLFIYEHIAHYQKQSLEYLLWAAGFSIIQEIPGIPDIEFAFVAKKQQSTKPSAGGGGQMQLVRKSLNWVFGISQKVEQILKEHSKSQGQIGMFGVNGIGALMTSLYPEVLSFICDEDIQKSHLRFLNKPILHPTKLENNSVVLVGFRNQKESTRIFDVLKSRYLKVKFIKVG